MRTTTRSEILTRLGTPRPARDHSCPLEPYLKVPNQFRSEGEWERWSHLDLRSMSPGQLATERSWAAIGKSIWHRERSEVIRSEIQRRHRRLP